MKFVELDDLMERGKAEGKIADYLGIVIEDAVRYYVRTYGIIYPDFDAEFSKLAIEAKQFSSYSTVDQTKLEQMRNEVLKLV
jgi:hypothetical protein